MRQEAPDEVKAKIIEEAPGGTLASGTGDVSTTGLLTKPVEKQLLDSLESVLN